MALSWAAWRWWPATATACRDPHCGLAPTFFSSANHGAKNKTLARPLRAPAPLPPHPHRPQLLQGPWPPDCPVSGMLPWPFLPPRVFFPVRVTALISPPPGSPHWPPAGLSSPFLVSKVCLVLCAHSCPGTWQALRNLKEETRVLLGVTDVWGALASCKALSCPPYSSSTRPVASTHQPGV